MRRAPLTAAALILALTGLSACGGDSGGGDGDAVVEADGGSAAVDTGAGAEETTGGTATVTVGSDTYAFVSDQHVGCRLLFGSLVMDLPMTEMNGAAVTEGSLSVEVPPADSPENGPGYVRLDLPDAIIYVATDADESGYIDIGYVGTEPIPALTVERDGIAVAGTQSLIRNSVETPEVIEADVEATCTT